MNRAACQPGIENKSAYAWASGVTLPYRSQPGVRLGHPHLGPLPLWRGRQVG